jgi:5-methylcytosine-specific restriction endonuclease McrA
VKQNEDISLRSIYKIYKETCQYCLKRIPFSEATRDHSYPKTLGGANEEHNIVLACKKCNNHKGHTYPYHNVLGEEVKPIARVRNGITIPGHLTIREEWKPYLYL